MGPTSLSATTQRAKGLWPRCPPNWGQQLERLAAIWASERWDLGGRCSTDTFRAGSTGCEAKQLKGRPTSSITVGSWNGDGLGGIHQHLRSLQGWAGFGALAGAEKPAPMQHNDNTGLFTWRALPGGPRINRSRPPGHLSLLTTLKRQIALSTHDHDSPGTTLAQALQQSGLPQTAPAPCATATQHPSCTSTPGSEEAAAKPAASGAVRLAYGASGSSTSLLCMEAQKLTISHLDYAPDSHGYYTCCGSAPEAFLDLVGASAI